MITGIIERCDTGYWLLWESEWCFFPKLEQMFEFMVRPTNGALNLRDSNGNTVGKAVLQS
jgi:hypothetical protein